MSGDHEDVTPASRKGCSEGSGLAAGDGAGESGTEAEPTDVDEPLEDRYTKAGGSPIDVGKEVPDTVAGNDEGRTEGAALEGARSLRRREARDAAGGGEPEEDEEVSVELLTWRTRRAGTRARAAPDGPAWSPWHLRWLARPRADVNVASQTLQRHRGASIKGTSVAVAKQRCYEGQDVSGESHTEHTLMQ
ncbi:hypothetical protein MRX96_043457 [Rhipicephalus microplus]